jgi:hypothetical protein
MSRKKLVYTKRVEGVQVYDDLPLECLGCGETYFLTSKICSRWRAEQLAKSDGHCSARYCKDCNDKFKQKNAVELKQKRERQAIITAKNRNQREEWQKARTKNIQVRCTCDRCGKEDVSEFVFHSKIRQPKGWRNHNSSTLRPGELLCPDCNRTKAAETKELREEAAKGDVAKLRNELWQRRAKLEEWAARMKREGWKQ